MLCIHGKNECPRCAAAVYMEQHHSDVVRYYRKLEEERAEIEEMEAAQWEFEQECLEKYTF